MKPTPPRPRLDRSAVRNARIEDAASLCDIYNPFIRDTIITFEEVPVAVEEMERRVCAVGERHAWLVGEEAGRVIGYAYATEWRPRSAYRYALETTVYVHPDFAARGLGTALYTELIEATRKREFTTLLGGIALPNPASVALHEKLGFKQVALLERVGHKFGRWIDVGYWQLGL